MVNRISKLLIFLFCTERGVTAVEYGLIAALISVVIISALFLVGGEVGTTFNTWSEAVRNAVQSSGS